jgi:hypothetical protein
VADECAERSDRRDGDELLSLCGLRSGHEFRDTLAATAVPAAGPTNLRRESWTVFIGT